MNSFLIPVTVTALILTGANVATAGAGCGMDKSRSHRAAMDHQGYGYRMPQPYEIGHRDAAVHDSSVRGHHRKQENTNPNIVEVATAAGSFGTLIAAVKAAGLTETLMGKGPYTVFAPTDEAFAKLPAGTIDALAADKARLTQVLTYHVVPGKLGANAITGVSKLSTVEGSELPVAGIKIAETDVMASNGIIHVIVEVLIPQS